MQRKLYEGPHEVIATCLVNIGAVHVLRRDPDRALDSFRQALAMEHKLYHRTHLTIVGTLNNIALAYRMQGDKTRALQVYDDALKELHLPPSDKPLSVAQLEPRQLRPLFETAAILHHRGLVLADTLPEKPTAAQLRDCEHCYSLASDVLDRVRQEGLAHETSKLLTGAEWVSLTPARVGICRRLYKLEGGPKDLRTAFHAAEQGRARVFLDALTRSRAGLLGGVSPELRDKEARLLSQVRAWDLRIEQAESRSGQTDTPLSKLWEARARAEAELESLITELEKSYPGYAALKYPRPCSVEEVRDCLAPDEVALLFVASYVVLVEGNPTPGDRAEGLAIYRLPDNEVIGDLVAALADREVLELPARVRSLGAELYGLLLRPLAKRLRGKNLVIVPDGPLCYLPFELLHEEAEGGMDRFLIEGHRIRYAPSLTALHLLRQWVGKREYRPDRPLWALGDPVYDARDERLMGKSKLATASLDTERELLGREGRGTEGFPRLRSSGEEVEAVRALLGAPPDSVVTGPNAIEARLKRDSTSGRLAQARYVHFACHGILGLHDGQPPALVLTLVGNSGTRDEFGTLDGFLRLDEVTQLRLNADLVVLSACRSGQGRLYNGEGVVGLARAFLHAGSRGVVCSLWSVDDRETADLMAAFYGRLKEGRPTADALRDTQLDMIRAGKPPLYWAPFILIGQ
jgi:CHAT domain-containing protein